MIAAVGIVKNEAPIIATTVRHLFAEGIDAVYLSVADSDDDTWGILERLSSNEHPILLIHDTDRHVHQASWTNRLAAMAAADGAEWIVPFDADEFFYATSGATIAETLNGYAYNKFIVTMYQHLDWNRKVILPKPIPKVVYRWSPDAILEIGNHNVSIPAGEPGVIDLRELQFLNFEHFVWKVHARLAVLDPQDKAQGAAHHYQRLENMNDGELRHEWELIQAQPTLVDPIPTRLPLGSVPRGLVP